MILRHPHELNAGIDREDAFEAIDERSGKVLGSCTVFVHENDELFPGRPIRIYMDIKGNPAPDALLGAAVARAKLIAQEFDAPCRIFSQVAPDDRERMNSLALLGFKDSDGLVCMRREFPFEVTSQLPIGSVVVRDDLDDPIEQKFFLERYGQLYNEDFDFEWLQGMRSRPGFKRILIVSPTGMVGECTTWHEGEAGRIGWLYVTRRWRSMGVSKCLLDEACRLFEENGLKCAEAEVQARVPGMLHVMESASFRQAKLILRYPGIDIR